MKTKHTKSSCCRAKVIKFGGRRRQCSICRKTWRIRQKKTGRKRQRVKTDIAISFLKNQRLSCYSLAAKLGKSEDVLNRKIKCSLEKFVAKTPYPKLPTKKPLIAIADSMMQQVERKMFSIYFILIKIPESKEAIIAPPYFEESKESALGWRNAFFSLPKPVFCSIVAVVSDGHVGLRSLALRNRWLMQRCHFHLLASLQGRRSRGRFSRHREIGELVFNLAKEIINSQDEKTIKPAIAKLKQIKSKTDSPGLRRLLRGFLKQYAQFRTFIEYPKLNLPRTSNSPESLIGCVRNLLRRAKGFRSTKSLKLWTEGLVKVKRRITCNSFHQPS